MKLSVITPSIRPQYLDITQKTLEAQTFQDFEFHVDIGLRNRGFGLPSDWNKLLRRCKGDIVVMLQDCISIPPDALQRISELSHAKTGYTYPLKKMPQGSYDWRKYRAEALGTEKLTPNMWEIDLASAPLSLFHDVGGFDEDFNNGWSWENVEIAYRAQAAGYKFYVSHATEGEALDHDAIIENPWRNKLPNNDKRANAARLRAEHGDFKLNYLF